MLNFYKIGFFCDELITTKATASDTSSNTKSKTTSETSSETTIKTTSETTSETTSKTKPKTTSETTPDIEDTNSTIGYNKNSPCSPNPCENNGYCLLDSSKNITKCLCSLKYAGKI